MSDAESTRPPRPPRTLADGCRGCGYSKVYCDGYRDISAEPCCRECDHRGD